MFGKILSSDSEAEEHTHLQHTTEPGGSVSPCHFTLKGQIQVPWPSSLGTFGLVKVTIKSPDLWRPFPLGFYQSHQGILIHPSTHFPPRVLWGTAPGKCKKVSGPKKGNFCCLCYDWVFNGAWKIHVITKNNSLGHWRQLSHKVNLLWQVNRNLALWVAFHFVCSHSAICG